MIIKVPEIDPANVLKEKRANAFMSRAEFAIVSAMQGWITEAEALSWAGGASIPAFVEDLIDRYVPAEERLAAKVLAVTASSVRRDADLVALLMLNKKEKVTDAEMDAVFGIEP